MTRSPATDTAYGAASFEVGGAPDAVAKTIQLFAIGAVATRNGNPPRVVVADRAHAEAIVAASQVRAGSTQLMIDYDHQSVFGARPGVGGRAPAAGWMTRLFATDDGIFADVEWTPAAQSQLAAREYRYISPFFHIQRGTDRVLKIINAGLTNTPNLDLAAVASATPGKDPDQMNMSRIAEALGLSADASEEEVLRAIAAMSTAKKAMTAVASAIDLAVDADGAAVAGAVAALRTRADAGPDPAKYVPIDAVNALQATMSDLKAQIDVIEQERVASAVDAAIAQGKLIPAQRDWAVGLATSNAAAFATFVENQPVLVRPGTEMAEGGKPAAKAERLTAEQQAVCSALGLDEAVFLKTLNEGAE